MLRFGFELEGFYKNEDGQITLPPKDYSTDDFPGLVEVRNTGGGDLEEQFYILLSHMDKYPSVDFWTWEHKFSPRERTAIRARHYEKGGVAINNIYGKAPKDIGSRTLASFQINISNYLGEHGGYKRYGIIDFVEITRELDNEFKEEIKMSGRQPGFYSIKDDIRFEYRSLPNAVILLKAQDLIKRIRKCL